MAERKPGWWWVRVGDIWSCDLVAGGKVWVALVPGSFESVDEWGPYLGTEPTDEPPTTVAYAALLPTADEAWAEALASEDPPGGEAADIWKHGFSKGRADG